MKSKNNLARKMFISTLVLTLFFICFSSANAADVHMNSTNNTISNAVANQSNNGDTIYLDEGTYNHTHLNGTNGININKNLTIIGKGTSNTIIDAQKQGRIFNITPNGTLSLINLTLINGNMTGQGGSIYSQGTLTLSNSRFINNTATSGGGAIFINSYNGNITAIIRNSDFTNNNGASGGVIETSSTRNGIVITIGDCNFINNLASNSAGRGGAIVNDVNVNININNCNFINNFANSSGGAIYNYRNQNKKIENCTFINNTSTATGSDSGGGAIYNNQGSPLTITNCIFYNNTARAGGAIYNVGTLIIESSNIFNNLGAIFSLNNTTIKYSRIFNNTIYDIYIATYDYPGYTSVVNASFNWWGTNDPDLEIKAGGRIRGTGNFTIDNFFVMNVINLTALNSNKNLIFNYTFGLNNTDHFDPSLLPYFETNFYNNITGFLESFDARYNKTLVDSISVRNKTIQYSFTTDNETQSFIAYIDPGNTNITVNSPNGKNGEIVDLVVNLTDENGNPLVGKTVRFNVAGRIFTAVTDENGVAKINYIIDKNDFVNNKLNFTVSFEGDEEYLSINGTGIITLDKTETNLVVNDSNGKNGETINITAKLTDIERNHLINREVVFNINGKQFIVSTNSEGIVMINYTIDKNDFVNGKLNITARFDGDDGYFASNGTGIITLDKTLTNLVVNNSNGKTGETVNLIANLTDENGNPLVGKTVRFNVAGKMLSAVTDENGVAKINYIIDKNDFVNNKLNFTVSFEGDEEYLSTNGTGIITLDKTKTNLVVNNSKGKIGETIVLIANLTDENGNLLSNKVIKFYIDGVYVGVAITDVNGVARFSYKPIKEGNFTITATFEGDVAYLNSTSKNLLTVTTEVEPTPTPSPEPTNKTKPTNQTNNNLININKTTATMKQTGIPILAILIVLLNSLGLVYRKK